MTTKTISGIDVDFDDENFMTDSTQWNEDIARALAVEDGIPELNDRHFTVIQFMRKEFDEKGSGPSIRRLTKESGVPTKELYQLFPGGPAKKSARIAGITKPQGCI